MMYLILACLLGVVAGLRSMVAPAAVSVAANFGLLQLAGTPLAFFGNRIVFYILIVLAIIELIVDQLPTTPSRKALMGFSARIIMGALCGAAISLAAGGSLWSIGIAGTIAGVIGAIIGTFAGAAFRTRLAQACGKDTPAALIEDLIAILGAALILMAL